MKLMHRCMPALAGLVSAFAIGCGGGEVATRVPTVDIPSVEAGAPEPPSSALPIASATPSVTASTDDPHGCAGQCRGRASPELVRALQTRAVDARRCYNKALASDPSLQGKSDVHVRIGQDGTVCSVEVLASSLPTDMNACVLGVYHQATYPAPVGGCIVAGVPITFVPLAPKQP